MKTEEEKEEAEIIKLIRLEFLKGGKRCWKKGRTTTVSSSIYRSRWGRGFRRVCGRHRTQLHGFAPRSGPSCPPGEPGRARCFVDKGWGCGTRWSRPSPPRLLRECCRLQFLERKEKKIKLRKLSYWYWKWLVDWAVGWKVPPLNTKWVFRLDRTKFKPNQIQLQLK